MTAHSVLPAAYRADWVFRESDEPLPGGIIEVDRNGRIAAIRCGPDRDAIDLGRAAIVPALVNAHVHLEFSELPGPIRPTGSFSGWVRQVVAYRRARTSPVAGSIRSGLDELVRCGTFAAGEIATSDEIDAYRGSIHVTLFRELIGPDSTDWPAILAAAERHLDLPHSAANVAFGLSPHAPYTVPQELFERSLELAIRRSAPVAVHLAETRAERALLAAGTGELVEMMQSLGLWRPELHPRGRRPADWIRSLTGSTPGLIIHGNYLEPDELDLLAAAPNLTLVYCPRTHDLFGHPPHPFPSLLDRGGRVALGTDGRSSSPDLALWQEAVFVAQRHPELSSATILDLITRNAAEALGISETYGSLAVGRPADFLAIQLAERAGSKLPDLFAGGGSVTRVFRGGIEQHLQDHETTWRA